MALVQRQRYSELTIVARHDCRALAEIRVDDSEHARLVANIGELRGHVAVTRPITFLDRNGDAGIARHRDALIAHRLSERTRTPYQPDGGQLARLEIGKDLFTCHLIGVRRLEDPRTHGLDDLNGSGQ